MPLMAIVDDNESIREAVEGLLRSIGFRAESFSSAEEFLVGRRLNEIGCLILDLKLGGMDGLELQRQLVAANLHIPIIFITAQSDERARAKALLMGAVDFLQKPCDGAALLHAVDIALSANLKYGGDTQ
jgi:FixJ family two-component response regulator